MKVRVTATALIEIENIFAYLSAKNPLAAKSVVARVGEKIAKLAEFPLIAQISDEPGVRRMPVGRYPFMILYTVENDEVVVLHVRHGARRSPFED